MKRIIRIEVRFDDGRERDRGPSRETKQTVMARPRRQPRPPPTPSSGPSPGWT
jgi:hypothetical protein